MKVNHDFTKENTFPLNINKTIAIGLKCKSTKTTRIDLNLLRKAIDFIENSGKDFADIGIINGEVLWMGDEDVKAGVIIAPRMKEEEQ